MHKQVIKTRADWSNILSLVEKVVGVKPFEVTLDTNYQKKTTPQLRYIHEVFKVIEQQRGRTQDFWKAKLKESLGVKLVHFDLDDTPFVEVVSLKDYNKEQMADFITKVQEYCARELDLQILTPEEYYESTTTKE